MSEEVWKGLSSENPMLDPCVNPDEEMMKCKDNATNVTINNEHSQISVFHLSVSLQKRFWVTLHLAIYIYVWPSGFAFIWLGYI